MRYILLFIFSFTIIAAHAQSLPDRARLKAISKQMYDEGNENYFVVDALRDSLFTFNYGYSVTYLGDSNLFLYTRDSLVAGKYYDYDTANKRFEIPIDQRNRILAQLDSLKLDSAQRLDFFRSVMKYKTNGAMKLPPALKEQYIAKLTQFLNKAGAGERDQLRLYSKEGISIDSLLNPASEFRQNSHGHLYQSGIKSPAYHKLMQQLVADGLAHPDVKRFELYYNNEDITVNGKVLDGTLHEKYIRIFKEHFGIDLVYGKISGQIVSDDGIGMYLK